MLRGQNEKEAIKEAIVNVLHILGRENVFYQIFLELSSSAWSYLPLPSLAI